jgi:hypothetical protein
MASPQFVEVQYVRQVRQLRSNVLEPGEDIDRFPAHDGRGRQVEGPPASTTRSWPARPRPNEGQQAGNDALRYWQHVRDRADATAGVNGDDVGHSHRCPGGRTAYFRMTKEAPPC